jgi:hypothetical protein
LQPTSHRLAQVAYALILTILLLALAVTAAIASEEQSAGDSGGTPETNQASPVRELPGRRTATSDTFELHSGLLETRVYGVPVNYQDAQGDWQPIDEGLEEADGGEIVNGAGSVEISLPSELQDGAARLTAGDEWVASRLLSTETEPAEVDGGAAIYESPDAEVAFEYTTLAEGLKEEIELKGPSSPSTFRYELTASAGVSAGLLGDGSVAFTDQQGDVVAALPAPTVADAGSLAPNSEEVSYQLAPRQEGRWLLTVAVDREWLEAPGRSWPVRVDPTMTAEKAVLDCVIGGKTGHPKPPRTPAASPSTGCSSPGTGRPTGSVTPRAKTGKQRAVTTRPRRSAQWIPRTEAAAPAGGVFRSRSARFRKKLKKMKT